MDINGLVVIGTLFGLFIYLLYAIFAYYKAKRRFDKMRAEFVSALNEESAVNSDSSDLAHPAIFNNNYSIHNELFDENQRDPIRALSDIYPELHSRQFTVSAGSKFSNED